MIYARPSKNFFFRRLARELMQERGDIGIDAASASMKNRFMFKTKRYIGIDRDEQALKAGLQKHGENTLGIVADLTRLSPLSSGSVSLIVSTNTLDHLAPADADAAIRFFFRILAP